MARGWTGRMPGRLGEAYGCPEPACYYYVRYKPGVEDHQCPMRGHSTYSWSETVKLVSEVWGYLDEAIDQVKDPEVPEHQRTVAGNTARAHCRTLLLFMRPFFHTEDEIAKEGMKRWKARQAGEERETPGLLHATYKTLTDGDAWYKAEDGGWTNDPTRAVGPPVMYPDAVKNRVDGAVAAVIKAAPRQASAMGIYQARDGLGWTADPEQSDAAKKTVKHNLSDEKVQAVIQFSKNGVSIADLAAMVKTTPEVIRSIIA